MMGLALAGKRKSADKESLESGSPVGLEEEKSAAGF